MKTQLAGLAVIALGAALAQPAFAQPYPSKAVRIIVPQAPGSATDVRWHGRPDRTFETSVEIDINGFYTPLPGDFAGTDRGDIVFWDETRTGDSLWSN